MEMVYMRRPMSNLPRHPVSPFREPSACRHPSTCPAHTSRRPMLFYVCKCVLAPSGLRCPTIDR